jgi:hypothetical protein
MQSVASRASPANISQKPLAGETRAKPLPSGVRKDAAFPTKTASAARPTSANASFNRVGKRKKAMKAERRTMVTRTVAAEPGRASKIVRVSP